MLVTDMLSSASRSGLRAPTRVLRRTAGRSRARISAGLVLSSLLVAIAAFAVPGAAAASDPATSPAPAASLAPATTPASLAVCPPAAPGYASCLSLLRTDIAARARALITPVAPPWGYGPPALQSAYSLAGPALSGGSNQTVAIVDAYDLPTAEADLGVYRTQYGLPACTTPNGCFRKVNQDGGTSPYPADRNT